MNKFVYIAITILIVQSCVQNGENKPEETTVSEIKAIATTKQEVLVNNSVVNRDSVNEFLSEPFDLYAFKRKKNGSLSGGVSFKDYHFKPSIRHVGYRFFMFEPRNTNYVVDGREMRHSKVGYSGASKENLRFSEDGLVVKTVQPFDKYKDKYDNPNEILIEVVAKYNDFDLPELAFIGLDSLSIIKSLGVPDFYRMKCLIYQYKNKALILKLNYKSVIWLKYVSLKPGVELAGENRILEI